LHVYDGHIHNSDFKERKAVVERDFIPVDHLIAQIVQAGLPAPAIVAGGTPSFPVHAMRQGIETSPGTTVLWDAGYRTNYPDMEFLESAILLMRVVSKPNRNLLCLDLGHKAIAAEMQPPRLRIPGLTAFRFISHSEEHLVIETPRAEEFSPGDLLTAVPWHICPTVPRYSSAFVVKDRKITGEWKVDARDRDIH
jgi:D-serine deaminase-like pyridoxal phosphate-dependent protein